MFLGIFLPVLGKEVFECIIDEVALFEVLQGADRTLEQDESDLEDIVGDLEFQVYRFLYWTFGELVLGGIKVEYTLLRKTYFLLLNFR